MRNIDNWIDKIEEWAQDQEVPLQDNIEMQMQEAVSLGNFEAVYLYDKEGLLIAECDGSLEDDKHRIIQISLMVHKVKGFVHDLASLSDLKEMALEDMEGRKIIFRFIAFFNQPAILVAIVPLRKKYRGLTNRLQRSISNMSFIES
jgi:hypothetical protein